MPCCRLNAAGTSGFIAGRFSFAKVGQLIMRLFRKLAEEIKNDGRLQAVIQ
jgi:hypothetical protein